MNAKGHQPAVIDEVLKKLVAERLLSNERFAEAYITARINKGFGPLRIQSELRERGVSDELVAIALDQADVCWKEQVETVRRKKFNSRMPDNYQERAKQMRFLQYKGFSTEQIRAAFKQDDSD